MSDEEQVNKPVDTSALLKWLTEAGYDLDYDSAYNLGSHLHLAGAANEDSDKGSVITTGEIIDVLNLDDSTPESKAAKSYLEGVSYGDHPLGDPNKGPRYWSSRNVVAKTELHNGVPVYHTPEYQEWILKEWPVDVASSLDYGKGGKAARHWGYHHGGTFSATAQEKWGTNTPVQGFLKYVAEQAQAQKKTSEIK